MKVEIYSDGSCNTSVALGAWAALVIIAGNQSEISGIVKNTTNQAMELQAVLSALGFMETMSTAFEKSTSIDHTSKNNSPVSALSIYTDSQYICNLPLRREILERNNFFTKNNKKLHNYEQIQLLYYYIDLYLIKFIKVKAHQKKGQSIASDRLRKVDKRARSIVRHSVLI